MFFHFLVEHLRQVIVGIAGSAGVVGRISRSLGMQHDFCFRTHFTHSRTTATEHVTQVRPITVCNSCVAVPICYKTMDARFTGCRGGIFQRTAVIPCGRVVTRVEHTVGNLVAHLHHIGRSTVIDQRRQHIFGVLVNGVLQFRLRGTFAGPAVRHHLLARVCPTVRVMDIQQEVQSRIFDALAENLDRGQTAA